MKKLGKAVIERRRVWTAALRSGQYQQGRQGYLCHKGRYCCLGVAVAEGLASPAPDWRSEQEISAASRRRLGLSDPLTDDLITLNDGPDDDGWPLLTFAEIADVIDLDTLMRGQTP